MLEPRTAVSLPNPRARVRRPRLPVATLLLEAGELLEVCREPSVAEALARVGLPEGLAPDLEARLDAARVAQARWAAARDRSTVKASLREREAHAKALRARLVAAGRWNLRHRTDALAALGRICAGGGVEDLVQDLFDLAALFERHAEAFARDGSLPLRARVREAREAGRTLSESIACARNDATRDALREERDHAFSQLEARVSEIRAAGRYAFQGDATRRRQFTSRHRARARRAAGTAREGEGLDAGG